ncbi:MAG: radical SAM protein [Thermotogota bacterium]
MKNIEFVKLRETKSISTTNNYCYLNCKHCNKHYLKDMNSISDIEELSIEGFKSFLISGGMNSKIEVPIIEHYNKLYTLKQKYNLKYNIHTGIIDNNDEYISKLYKLHDSISFDIVGSESVYKNVYNNNYYKEMISSFYTLMNNNFNVKPHITIGLEGGQINHEYDAIKILKNSFNKLDELIFIIFIPTKDTFYEKKNPPILNEVEKIMKLYRKEFPDIKLTLGCMQPKGTYKKELQKMSLKYMDKIVQPINNTIKRAENNNFIINYSFQCCAL